MDTFVPYRLSSVGSYTMAAFLHGPPVADKKKNAMDEPQRGFYVAVTIYPYDFQGINDSGEPAMRGPCDRAR